MIYLDNAATTLYKPKIVTRSFNYFTQHLSANAGRGSHEKSKQAATAIYNTQNALGKLLNIKAFDKIAFTQNATLGLNMGILGAMQDGGHVITTALDHNSVLRPVYSLKNAEKTIVEVGKDGIIDPDDIKKAMRSDTKIIVITHISNMLGTIQPIEEICKIAKENGTIFMLDAAQSAGAYNIDVDNLGIDIIAFSGHKGLMAPLGTGGIYVADNVKISPIITGGTGSMSESLTQPDFMPDMLQSGTLNTPAIAALGVATEYVMSQGIEKIHTREVNLAKMLYEQIQYIDGITVYGTKNFTKRNGTVSFNIDGIDPVEVATRLDEENNIAVRAGFHCAYLAHKAVGSDVLGGTVRASFGYFNTERDMYVLARAIANIVRNGR